jgi:hypothetical protein
MRKIKMKSISSARVFCMIVGGIMTVLFAHAIVDDTQFKQTAQQTTATISSIEAYRDSDGERRYNVYIDYEVNGRQYSNISLRFHTRDMQEGQGVSIYYDSDDPTRIAPDRADLPITYVVCLILSIVFFLIGLVPIAEILYALPRKDGARRA